MATRDTASGKTKKTVDRYEVTRGYWNVWCKAKGVAPEEALKLVRPLRDAEVCMESGIVCDPAIEFLEWLGKHSIAASQIVFTEKDKRTVSCETWDQATKWLWHNMNVQLAEAKKLTLFEGFIGKLPGMKALKERVNEAEAARKHENCQEADQRSDLQATFEQQIAMTELVLSAKAFQQSLQGLQCLLATRGMFAMANRGMNWRSVQLSHLYFTEYPCDMLSDKCSVKGLVMKNIKVKSDKEMAAPKYTAALPHYNPIFCTIFYLGLCLLHRFAVLMEAMPSLNDPKSWHHLTVLRAMQPVKGAVQKVSDTSLLDSVKKMYSDSGIQAETNDSATHLGRHQSQVEATKAGVNDRDQERACNYQLGQREKHYSVIVPISWQLQRAGYTWSDPQTLAAHLRAMVYFTSMLDELIELLLPALKQLKLQLLQMAEAIAKLPKKDQPKARKERKLRSATSLVEFLYNTFRVTIACTAARAKDEAGLIQGLPLYRLYARSPVFALLSINGRPFTEHQTFLLFASKVAIMENDLSNTHTPRSSKIARAVKDSLAPQLEATRNLMMQAISESQSLRQQGSSSEATGATAVEEGDPSKRAKVQATAAAVDVMPVADAVGESAALASAIALAAVALNPIKAKAFADQLAAMQGDAGSEIMKKGLQAAEESVRSKIITLEEPSPSKKRIRQEDAAADGQVLVRPLADHNNSVAHLWNYYLKELRPLELKDISWRTRNKQVSDSFRDRLCFFREIALVAKEKGEKESVALLQKRLDQATSWKKLKTELDKDHKTLNKLDSLLKEGVFTGV